MNKENLLKLADFIENNVRDDQFDMNHVVRSENQFTKPPSYNVEDLKTLKGVTFCAMGLIPICFPESWAKYVLMDPPYECYVEDEDDSADYLLSSLLFDIDKWDAHHLFGVCDENRESVVYKLKYFANNGVFPLVV